LGCDPIDSPFGCFQILEQGEGEGGEVFFGSDPLIASSRSVRTTGRTHPNTRAMRTIPTRSIGRPFDPRVHRWLDEVAIQNKPPLPPLLPVQRSGSSRKGCRAHRIRTDLSVQRSGSSRKGCRSVAEVLPVHEAPASSRKSAIRRYGSMNQLSSASRLSRSFASGSITITPPLSKNAATVGRSFSSDSNTAG
jgi:hypothetical protein